MPLRPNEDVALMRGVLERIAVLDPLKEVCRKHHVLLEAVLAGKRSVCVVRARDECCAYLRGLELSLAEIGSAIGLDHSSVVSALRRHAARAATEATP